MHGWEYLRDEDRDTILQGVREGRALGGPYHAEIDPIDVCNADCFFCCSESLRAGAVLRWEKLGPVVDDLIAGGLRSVRLAGGGEPLIYPDIAPLCERLAKAGVVIDNLTTNGIKMNDAMLDHLLKTRVAHFYVSLNYSNRDDYQDYMRVPANRFDWIVENFRRVDQRLRKEGRRHESLLHAQFMIHRSTIEAMPEMIDLALDLPVDCIVLRGLGNVSPEESFRPEDERRFRELLPEAIERTRGKRWVVLDLAEYGEDLQKFCVGLMQNLRAEPESLEPPYTHGPAYPDPLALDLQGIEYCYVGWHSITLQGNGDAHPCCYLMHYDNFPPFGNVLQNTIPEIWNGPMYQRHREEMRAVMLKGKSPGQRRRFVCTIEACWERDRCPLANQMADPAFYLQAHEALDQLRRRPATRLARAGNFASRQVLKGGRRLVGAA